MTENNLWNSFFHKSTQHVPLTVHAMVLTKMRLPNQKKNIWIDVHITKPLSELALHLFASHLYLWPKNCRNRWFPNPNHLCYSTKHPKILMWLASVPNSCCCDWCETRKYLCLVRHQMYYQLQITTFFIQFDSYSHKHLTLGNFESKLCRELAPILANCELERSATFWQIKIQLRRLFRCLAPFIDKPKCAFHSLTFELDAPLMVGSMR